MKTAPEEPAATQQAMSARSAAVAHDVSLAWIAGGVLVAAVAAVLLFRVAPSREVAGQVGQAIFNWLGRLMLVLSLVAAGSRLAIQRAAPAAAAFSRPTSWGSGPGSRRAFPLDIVLCGLMVAASATLALWLTPAMAAIWETAPHDPGGTGLMGADKTRFMRMHGAGNLLYLTLFGASTLLIARRALVTR